VIPTVVASLATERDSSFAQADDSAVGGTHDGAPALFVVHVKASVVIPLSQVTMHVVPTAVVEQLPVTFPELEAEEEYTRLVGQPLGPEVDPGVPVAAAPVVVELPLETAPDPAPVVEEPVLGLDDVDGADPVATEALEDDVEGYDPDEGREPVLGYEPEG